MSILFQDDLTTIIHGRWQDHTEALDAADALVTDPPYGMGYVSNRSKLGPTPPIRGDSSTQERDELLDAWFGGPVPDRPALVFGTWRCPRPTFMVRELIIWHKRGGWIGDVTLPWGPAHEEIYVMGGRREGSWTGKREANVITTGRRAGSARNAHVAYGHPTPKSVALMQELIKHIPEDFTVIDPFAGAGATGVAARLLGRRCVLIEVEKNYARACVERVERIPPPDNATPPQSHPSAGGRST